jgi:hypothetical protein
MRVGMIDTQAIRERWNAVVSKLDERGGSVRSRTGSAGGMARLKAVSRITGLARSTINRGPTALDPKVNDWRLKLRKTAPSSHRGPSEPRLWGAPRYRPMVKVALH